MGRPRLRALVAAIGLTRTALLTIASIIGSLLNAYRQLWQIHRESR